MDKRLELVKQDDGSRSIDLYVSIDRNGDLLFSGCDVGKSAKEFFGDYDYEY